MNMTKSEQIKAGLHKSFQGGASAKASTVCYGYKVTTTGDLLVYHTEAVIVFHIFERLAAGDSLGQIATSLARMNVASPTGKSMWNRETISKILSNEKYVGDVALGKTKVMDGKQVKVSDIAEQIVVTDHHPALISRELFHAVQQEKQRRGRKQVHSHNR